MLNVHISKNLKTTYKRTLLKLIVATIYLITIFTTTDAQNVELTNKNKKKLKNLIGISIGLSDFHVREEMASPLTYWNNGITACLEYIRVGDNYKHQIELDGYYSKIKTVYEEYYAHNSRAGFRYSYLHKFLSLNTSTNLNLYAGGGGYSFINLS